MYDYNPNFSAAGDYVPAAGTAAATIVGLNGKSCNWVNETSGDSISVSVADLSNVRLAPIQTGIQSHSTSTSIYGVTGYFSVTGGTGTADAFSGSFWVSVSSVEFVTASDAETLMTEALSALTG